MNNTWIIHTTFKSYFMFFFFFYKLIILYSKDDWNWLKSEFSLLQEKTEQSDNYSFMWSAKPQTF